MTGRYELGFLQTGGGLDDQDWEWVEDVNLICETFNILR